jgi:hypothetical protein
MARPAHRPDPVTRRQVEAMAGFGVPEVDIAGVVGIDPKTLRKHYPEELRLGHVKANAKVAENLFRKATGDGRESVIAAIFWMKARAGWKETNVHEVGGAPNAPLQIDVQLVSAREQLQRRLSELAERGRVIDHCSEDQADQPAGRRPPGRPW